MLLVERAANRERVARCCTGAARAGIHAGMTLAHARALLPDVPLHTEPVAPDRDASALAALAQWALRFSPVVALDPPDGLFLDIAGCEHLFGGEDALARRVLRALTRMGIEARAAIASTPGCAWGLARFAPHTPAAVPAGAECGALAPLPVRALRVQPGTEESLREVGVTHVAHLLALDRHALASRFGAHLLQRLDRALGRESEPLVSIRPEAPISFERLFDGPVDRPEWIEAGARDLLAHACASLAQQERGARRLDLVLHRADLTPLCLVFELCRPSRSERHLWRLVQPRLARANLGFGVQALTLLVPRTGRLRHAQARCWDDHDTPAHEHEEDESLAELLDTLVARLGSERVVRMIPVGTHIPEDAFEARPATRPVPRADWTAQTTPHPRPSILLEPPEHAHVIAVTPDGPVVRLRWRATEHAVEATIGPERIAPPWWRSNGPSRDYFRVCTHRGTWLWLCREVETARWFVGGVWA